MTASNLIQASLLHAITICNGCAYIVTGIDVSGTLYTSVMNLSSTFVMLRVDKGEEEGLPRIVCKRGIGLVIGELWSGEGLCGS